MDANVEGNAPAAAGRTEQTRQQRKHANSSVVFAGQLRSKAHVSSAVQADQLKSERRDPQMGRGK